MTKTSYCPHCKAVVEVYRSILKSVLEMADDSISAGRQFPVNRLRRGIRCGLSPSELAKIGEIVWDDDAGDSG